MTKVFKIFEYLQNLDRRVIFFLIAAVVVFGVLTPIKFPVTVTPEVQKAYDEIEKLPEGTPIYIALDYDPGTAAEMAPLAEAVLRHAYSRNLKVVSGCLVAIGVNMVESTLKDISDEYGKKYGEDYVFLGYKPYPAFVIMNMGENFRINFPNDFYHNKVDELPLMKGIKNYENLGLIFVVTSTSGIETWLTYGQGKYSFPMVAGLSAVMATDYFPFLDSGQIKGLVAGLKGASEYEKLNKRPDWATKGMVVQSFAHILILFFILICNLCYFITGRKERRF